MNYEELLEKIKDIGARKLANEDFDTNDLPLELVHSEGGYEGAGEYAERVFEHDNAGEKIYLKITGFYSSYEGTDWDSDVTRVTPAQRTVTVYE